MRRSVRFPLYLAAAFVLLLSGETPLVFGQESPAAAPDNTKVNKRDRHGAGITADSQKIDKADQDLSRNIRKAIVKDKSLSTYAHNVKIVSIDGAVTLKGPVRSDQEKQAIETKASAIAGAGKVTSELTVAPGK
jgi:hypothetical protein